MTKLGSGGLSPYVNEASKRLGSRERTTSQ